MARSKKFRRENAADAQDEQAPFNQGALKDDRACKSEDGKEKVNE